MTRPVMTAGVGMTTVCEKETWRQESKNGGTHNKSVVHMESPAITITSSAQKARWKANNPSSSHTPPFQGSMPSPDESIAVVSCHPRASYT